LETIAILAVSTDYILGRGHDQSPIREPVPESIGAYSFVSHEEVFELEAYSDDFLDVFYLVKLSNY
jgi:hypothetical protein